MPSLSLLLFLRPYGGADAAEDTHECGTTPVRFMGTAQEARVEKCAHRSSRRGNQKVFHGSQMIAELDMIPLAAALASGYGR
jgi:hypothetical protein